MKEFARKWLLPQTLSWHLPVTTEGNHKERFKHKARALPLYANVWKECMWLRIKPRPRPLVDMAMKCHFPQRVGNL
jgi:hypothetical protein